jgi:hypothetical protein
MRAARAEQFALIRDQDHEKAPVVCPDTGCVPVGGHTPVPYSLETGLSDVTAYYDAGTIIHALQDIAVAAGQQQQSAKDKQQVNATKPQFL